MTTHAWPTQIMFFFMLEPGCYDDISSTSPYSYYVWKWQIVISRWSFIHVINRGFFSLTDAWPIQPVWFYITMPNVLILIIKHSGTTLRPSSSLYICWTNSGMQIYANVLKTFQQIPLSINVFVYLFHAFIHLVMPLAYLTCICCRLLSEAFVRKRPQAYS